MKDLVDYIVKNLVTNPNGVIIEESSIGEGEVNLLLTVDPADMGIVIGKSGQTIKAIRRLLGVRAMNDNVRVNLQLSEVEGREPKESTATAENKETETKEEVENSKPADDSNTDEDK